MSIERTKKQIEVMQAYTEGRQIEILLNHHPSKWTLIDSPIWNWSLNDYRIRTTKPDVPWDALADWVQYVARDADGLLKGYAEKPTLNSSYWDYTGGQAFVTLNRIVKYTLGTCHWRDSLVERPKGGDA